MAEDLGVSPERYDRRTGPCPRTASPPLRLTTSPIRPADEYMESCPHMGRQPERGGEQRRLAPASSCVRIGPWALRETAQAHWSLSRLWLRLFQRQTRGCEASECDGTACGSGFMSSNANGPTRPIQHKESAGHVGQGVDCQVRTRTSSPLLRFHGHDLAKGNKRLTNLRAPLQQMATGWQRDSAWGLVYNQSLCPLACRSKYSHHLFRALSVWEYGSQWNPHDIHLLPSNHGLKVMLNLQGWSS